MGVILNRLLRFVVFWLPNLAIILHVTLVPGVGLYVLHLYLYLLSDFSTAQATTAHTRPVPAVACSMGIETKLNTLINSSISLPYLRPGHRQTPAEGNLPLQPSPV